MLSRAFRFLMRSLSSVFSPIAAGIFAAGSIGVFLVFVLYLGRVDKGSNPNYLFIALIALVAWACAFGFAAGCGVLRRHLPVLALPAAFIAMEMINFSFCTKLQFYCQVYHYVFYGLILLGIDFGIAQCLPKNRLGTILNRAELLLVGFLYWVLCLIVVNVFLNGSGIDNDAMIAISQTDATEGSYYFFHENHGLALLLIGAGIALAIGGIVYCLWRLRSPALEGKRQPAMTGILLPVLPLLLIGIASNQFAYFLPPTWKTLMVNRDYRMQKKRYAEKRVAYMEYVKRELDKEQKGIGSEGLFVVVIGESASRRYMQCYGYHQPTTPFQQSLLEQPNLFLFRDAYACHVQTVKVLSLMLTNRNQYDGQKLGLTNLVSVIDLLAHYGYRTAWLSNQNMYTQDSWTTPLVETADVRVSLKDYGKRKSETFYDLDLLKEAEKLKPAKREVVFVHLWGNHLPYQNTYPVDFHAPEEFTAYEKSMRYNDSVLKALFDFFSKRNLKMMMYIPDHGDGVSIGKGHDPRPQGYVHEMIEVPFWVYLAPDYAAAHPELVAKLKIAEKRVITNDLIFNLLLGIMKIDNRFTESRYSPLSDDYLLNRDNALTLWRRRRVFNDIGEIGKEGE